LEKGDVIFMVRDMTETNLRSAYAGESQAHMRYMIYADRAKAKFPNVARLFTAIAFAEQVHATNHYRNIMSKGGFTVVSAAPFGAKNTSEDLQAGIDGETFEIEEMYPAYLEEAKFQKEKGAETSFGYAWSAEKIHKAMYEKAKKTVDTGKDIKLGPMQICSVCGHTIEGDAPDKCPVCGSPKSAYRTFP
jgi:rubrerythrin